MDPLNIFKGAVSLVVATGVGTIVGNVIKATTPLDQKLINRISVGVGGYFLTTTVGDIVADRLNTQIDNTITKVKEHRAAKKQID